MVRVPSSPFSSFGTLIAFYSADSNLSHDLFDKLGRVNLIMDTMAALALATDAPSPDLIDRPPLVYIIACL